MFKIVSTLFFIATLSTSAQSALLCNSKEYSQTAYVTGITSNLGGAGLLTIDVKLEDSTTKLYGLSSDYGTDTSAGNTNLSIAQLALATGLPVKLWCEKEDATWSTIHISAEY